MKYNMMPEITLDILADEIRYQYDVDPIELIDEFNSLDEFPFQFHYDELTQDEWRACERNNEGAIYSQMLMAASIFEDVFPDWTYVFITK